MQHSKQLKRFCPGLLHNKIIQEFITIYLSLSLLVHRTVSVDNLSWNVVTV